MKTKVLNVALLLLIGIVLPFTASAGMWDTFQAAITSRGSFPIAKSYHIQPHESMGSVDYLEFQEYSNSLKIRLKELGYVETNKEEAALHIKLGYYIGEKETVATTSSSRSYSISNSSININSAKSTKSTANASVVGFSGIAFGSGSKSSTSNSNTQINGLNFSHGGGSTTTLSENGTPCYLRIEAIDVKSNNPQWTLDMEVIIDNLSRFPNIFPWMCLVSKWYIGKSFSGKVSIENTKKKCFKIYNLPQYFDSNYWSLQYHYFGYSDVYIKKDPMPLVY